jgi:hypothetical protein
VNWQDYGRQREGRVYKAASDYESRKDEEGDMSDLTKLKEILDNQAERGINSGDWNRALYRTEKTEAGIYIHIHSDDVGFAFTKKGRFVGISNWKD